MVPGWILQDQLLGQGRPHCLRYHDSRFLGLHQGSRERFVHTEGLLSRPATRRSVVLMRFALEGGALRGQSSAREGGRDQQQIPEIYFDLRLGAEERRKFDERS